MPPSSSSHVLFIDRALGTEDVASALKAAGANVELHRDYFADDLDDPTWIKDVAERQWAILTKDKRIRHNKLERLTLEQAGAAAFILTAGDISGGTMAAAFVRALPRIMKILEKYERPVIATVGQAGTVTVIIGERRGGIRR